MAARQLGGIVVLAARFAVGRPMDGALRTNATLLRPPTKALHPTADRSWWHWRPGWHRGGIRIGVLALAAAVAYGLIAALAVTLAAMAVAAAAAAGYAAWRLGCGLASWVRAARTRNREHPPANLGAAAWVFLALPYQHHVYYRRPLISRLAAELNAPPVRVKVPFDRSGATVWTPPHWTGGDKGQEGVTRAVTATLALEAPDVTPRLHGRKPRIMYTLADPPPSRLTWEDVEDIIAAARAHELITGLGKKRVSVAVSAELDSPHFLLAMGSGGGKSNTAAFWLVQRLMLGDIALILDAKWFSHPWTFKDMHAGYGQLPNVAYARSTQQLHDAMTWLGVELQRRTEVAEAAVNAKGDILGDVGPRLWVVAEEMNLATPRLKQFWADERGKEQPKRSPAMDGMAAVAFAGRAVKMHLITIGQMLTAASLGGGDVRENMGVRVLARYTANSWKMQAGDLPMPPSPGTPGRVQVVTGGEVREAQVPLMDLGQCRELAVSGTVTSCAEHMPMLPPGLAVPPDAISDTRPDLGIVLGRGGIPGRPPGTITASEAHREGLYPSLEAARKALQRAVERRQIAPAGKDGTANLFYISDIARLKEKK